VYGCVRLDLLVRRIDFTLGTQSYSGLERCESPCAEVWLRRPGQVPKSEDRLVIMHNG
jgi:hypothetical protein